MARTFQIKRGPASRLPVLAQAELAMTTDSGAEKVHIGTGTENLEMALRKDVALVGHTHTPASIGAATTSHTHTPVAIGAAVAPTISQIDITAGSTTLANGKMYLVYE